MAEGLRTGGAGSDDRPGPRHPGAGPDDGRRVCGKGGGPPRPRDQPRRPRDHRRSPLIAQAPLDAPSSAPLTSGAMATTEPSKRLQVLPRYLFAELERKRHEAESAGREVIDLSIGDPDLPTPQPVLDQIAAESLAPQNHRYPTSAGLLEVRTRIARWFQQRYGVTLDPTREVAILIGSKEGIGHFPLAILNPGDEALVPDPGYPVYTAGTVFAGATPVRFPIQEEQGFLPKMSDLDRLVTDKTRVVFVNYPNNPTGATAPPEFYDLITDWAARRGLLVVSDAAYSELYYDDPPHSIFEIPAARPQSIEFHSFSKTFNMT